MGRKIYKNDKLEKTTLVHTSFYTVIWSFNDSKVF